MSLLFGNFRTNQYESHSSRRFSFVSPSVARSVLHHDVMFFQMNGLAVVEFEPNFAVEYDAIVDRGRCVHTRMIGLE